MGLEKLNLIFDVIQYLYKIENVFPKSLLMNRQNL